MKTRMKFSDDRRAAPKPGERGTITVVLIALLAIMLMLVVAESQALIHLRRTEKLLEQKQIERLNGPTTNAVPVAAAAPQ